MFGLFKYIIFVLLVFNIMKRVFNRFIFLLFILIFTACKELSLEKKFRLCIMQRLLFLHLCYLNVIGLIWNRLGLRWLFITTLSGVRRVRLVVLRSGTISEIIIPILWTVVSRRSLFSRRLVGIFVKFRSLYAIAMQIIRSSSIPPEHFYGPILPSRRIDAVMRFYWIEKIVWLQSALHFTTMLFGIFISGFFLSCCDPKINQFKLSSDE